MKEFELEKGEHTVKSVRKHWFVFVLELLPYAILAALPLALPRAIELAPVPLLTIDFSSPLARTLLSVWWLGVWTGAFAAFTRYFLNLWVLTNMRVVDIHQKSFFHRDVSSLVLSRVQDITVETKGLMYSLLDIGTINVQSAGAIERFTIRGIPHPAMLRDIILKYVPNPDAAGL
ncbi:hypothetical protein A3H77_02380 [Candidatus Kaiserbacteria bacterium RIFCSPLOWO2_02_FULL_56_11]|uniref:YdbS-like PH domain-containing protein n=2 Tax=Candidatus Kaiseribacteriota TaxID=1752734 RepID=A0A1F6E534_9BACT|nr:MAG: hypothetical protein A3C95_01320 [Candidatus Kaiserbacteria bacterium RIFCSPHIGHO2_02_FULL_56_30]OGG72318.1 MAG: hypothetical protein A3E65_00550 [Candidatus Kaiserbacteria bacterium RIFCSPHIGHO2_12_FULL_56_13]OGG80873.1 MAG: hypothetical protein A3H77_02380 [Candidatus Kaiserbacteria bacterium RIFCSPLOWO2_02_FULL_56_11]